MYLNLPLLNIDYFPQKSSCMGRRPSEFWLCYDTPCRSWVGQTNARYALVERLYLLSLFLG